MKFDHQDIYAIVQLFYGFGMTALRSLKNTRELFIDCTDLRLLGIDSNGWDRNTINISLLLILLVLLLKWYHI